MTEKSVLDKMYDVLQERKKIQTWFETGEITRGEFEDKLETINAKMEAIRKNPTNPPMHIEMEFYEPPVEKDMVDQPAHYASRKYEVWDVMEDTMTREQFIGYNLGATIKYLMRWDKKGYPLQDLKKARNYLNKLIQTIEEEAE